MERELPAQASFDEAIAYLRARHLHFGLVGLTDPQGDPPRDGRAIWTSKCSGKKALTGTAEAALLV